MKTISHPQVIMLTLTPSAKSSTSAPLMKKRPWAPSPSSAPTEPSSTRTTSSAIGGSTLTALKLKVSTHSMIKWQLREKSLQMLHPTVCQLTQLDLLDLFPNQPMRTTGLEDLGTLAKIFFKSNWEFRSCFAICCYYSFKKSSHISDHPVI